MGSQPVRAEIERRVTAFVDACRRDGLKATSQRIEVYRELASTGEHPDAETLYERVRGRLPTISRDTVYRTLSMLEERGIITRLTAFSSRARYDGNPDRHHHFMCTECGLVRDFHSRRLDELKPPRQVRSLGSVEDVQVQLSGVCRQCRERSRRRGARKEKS